MISILGAGAIGQLIAHKLTDAQVDCQLIVRDDADFVRSAWQLEQNDASINREIAFDRVSATTPLSTVCVCVKSPQLAQALEQIKHRITKNTQLILFQNGMGHETLASQFVSPENIFFASNTHGVFQKDKQHILYAGQGNLQIGALAGVQTRQPGWFECFAQADLDSQWQSDIESVLYRKLLVNACINPLTAIYQCKNGELLSAPYKARLLALINENSLFAQEIGLTFEDDLKSLVIEVLQKTADNKNSMLQDVSLGQTTEINAINGYLLTQMELHNFKAPHNWKLWSDFHIQFPPLKKVAQARLSKLSPEQLQVTQNHGTERPFTGQYNIHQEQGDYLCICCDSPLFDSNGKFDSGCGWPSFDRAQNNKAVVYHADNSHNMSRVEILCAQCGSHLGHVFEDGPTETGQRFCVNSASLQFKQES